MFPILWQRFLLALGTLAGFVAWQLLDGPILHGVAFLSGASLVESRSPLAVLALVIATILLSVPSLVAFGGMVTFLSELDADRKGSRLATWSARIGFLLGLPLVGHLVFRVAISLSGGLTGILRAPAAEAATLLGDTPGALVVAAAYGGARVVTCAVLVTFFVMLCGARKVDPERTGIPWRWIGRGGGIGVVAGLAVAGWLRA